MSLVISLQTSSSLLSTLVDSSSMPFFSLDTPSSTSSSFSSSITTMASSSSSSSSSSCKDMIPLKALVSFHSSERRLFVRMVFHVGVNPNLAMEIIAFWMWLEEAGHPNVIRPILHLSDDRVRSVAIEAKKCIAGLPDSTDPVSLSTDVNATYTVDDSPVNINFVNSRRSHALIGIISTLNNVCVKIFSDLAGLFDVIKKNKRPLDLSDWVIQMMNDMSTSSNLTNLSLVMMMMVMGSLGGSNPTGGSSNLSNGSVLSMYHQLLLGQQQQQANNLSTLVQSRRPEEKEVPRDERTLFVTFSNGYPLNEDDLRAFFIRNYGEIEVIYMQQVSQREEPLFARIVFNLQETILLVLNGSEKVKFIIKGKHVWARRYIPKKKRRSNSA